MTSIEVTKAFIGMINAHSLDDLYELMTEDHTFVDGGGTVTQGRKTMRDAWQSYFSLMPDYLITVERIFAEKNIVGLFGKASGTYSSDGKLKPENKWQVPAAWLAVIRDDKVAHWQVYADNDTVRQIIAKEQEHSKTS
jgi:ketosteroid isomerase-like protein